MGFVRPFGGAKKGERRRFRPSILLGAVLLGGLVAVMTPAQADEGVPSPLNGLKGKKLEIVWSGNDPLCKKLFDFYDKRYDPESSKVFHEEDPIFLRWQSAKNIRDAAMEWVEADIDNDGTPELLTRVHYQKHNEHVSIIAARKSLTVNDFLNNTSILIINKILHDNEKNGFLINFNPFPKNKPAKFKSHFYTLYQHPNFDVNKSSYKPYYDHFGRLSLLAYDGVFYVMAYHSLDITMHNSIWGILVKILPDRTADDICYFDRRNRDRK